MGDNMELSDARLIAREMIKKFVNDIGLDGEYYSNNDCPMKYYKVNYLGRTFSPNDRALKNMLSNFDLSEEEKEKIKERGLIIISQKLSNDIEELLITIIHEQLHSNRMILTNGYYCKDEDEEYSEYYIDGNFIKKDYDSDYIGDASQEIYKASIDTSDTSKEDLKKLSEEELKRIQIETVNQIEERLMVHGKIDEAIVELMARVAYENYYEDKTIMEIIEDINNKEISEDLIAMTNIILRHGDLELFKWMIDPLYYQVDDINYNFLGSYLTSNDYDDLKEIADIDDDLAIKPLLK